MCFLLIVVQETAARMGCVTGVIAGARARHPPVHTGTQRTPSTLLLLSPNSQAASSMKLFGIPNGSRIHQRTDGVAPKLLVDRTAASRRFYWQLAEPYWLNQRLCHHSAAFRRTVIHSLLVANIGNTDCTCTWLPNVVEEL